MGKIALNQRAMEVKESTSYQTWARLMEYGDRFGCHQKPERSFFVKGYQLPICARCLGVYIGYILALPTYLVFGFRNLRGWAFLGCDCMLIDWVLQAYQVKKSTNTRRLVTGIMGGFGLMVLLLGTILKIVGWTRK